MIEEFEKSLPEEDESRSAIFGALSSVERILGAVIIFCALAVVIFLWQGIVPVVELRSPEAPVVSEGGTETGISVLLWIVLVVAGVRILVLERHRLGLRAIGAWCPEKPPAWGICDCAKVMALSFVGSYALLLLAAEVIRNDGFLLRGLVSSREEIILSGFLLNMPIFAFVVLLLYTRGATIRKFGLEGIAFVSGAAKSLKVWIAFAPVFFLLGLSSKVGIDLVCELFGLEYIARPQAVALWMIDVNLSGWVRLAFCFFAVVFAPVSEEVIFRGLLYGSLRHYFTWPVCAAVSGVIFGAVHNGLPQLLPLAGFGILLALLREHTRGLAVPIMVHSIHNAFMLVMIFSLG